jgi:hypothetical protein
MREMQIVFDEDGDFSHLSFEDKLDELDKRMGTKKQRSGQNSVMGGNFTPRGKSGKVTLTAKQQEIAVRTKFGGPKAKSDAEHLEAYRKQIERLASESQSKRA